MGDNGMLVAGLAVSASPDISTISPTSGACRHSSTVGDALVALRRRRFVISSSRVLDGGIFTNGR